MGGFVYSETEDSAHGFDSELLEDHVLNVLGGHIERPVLCEGELEKLKPPGRDQPWKDAFPFVEDKSGVGPASFAFPAHQPAIQPMF